MKKVQGVGINDATYSIVRHEKGEDGKFKIVWRCPFYAKWSHMLKRCYGKDKPRSYEDVVVCNDWLTFSNFKAWMEQQDWEGKELDKDLLFPNNKVYGPETCVFINHTVNSFITEIKSKRSDLPTGVNLDSYTGRYKATVRFDNGKYLTIGRFDTPEEAFSAWLTKKLELAEDLAAKQSDIRVAEALVRRYATTYRTHIQNIEVDKE